MDERFFERMTLLELLQLLRKRLALVIALPIVCALAMGAYSYFFMSNTYTASTSLYVLTKTETSNGSSNMYSDLNASQLLTNDVATLIKSDRVMGDTAKALSMQSLAGFDVAITSETTTRVITLSVTAKMQTQRPLWPTSSLKVLLALRRRSWTSRALTLLTKQLPQ